MGSPSTTTLGSINTPLSPGEALARFSPLESCGGRPLRLPKRQNSSRWRHDHGNWWVEEGKATIVTRSVSASAVPVAAIPRRSFQPDHLNRDRVTGWRPTVRREQSMDYTYPAYTPQQIAGFQLYEIKTRRLSSHEYGQCRQPGDQEPVIVEQPTESSLRVVELEADTPRISPPTASPANFQSPPIASPSKQSPLQFPSQVSSQTIIRKPVGSTPRTITPKSVRSKSDPLLIWPLEEISSLSPLRQRSQSPKKQERGYDYSSTETSQILSPWDSHDPPDSPSLRPRGPRPVPDVKRSHPPVRFQSERTNLQSPSSKIRAHSDNHPCHRKDSVSLAEVLGLESTLTPQNVETTKEWSIWAAKILFSLYLAACLWNVLAAVKDAVLMALEPVVGLLSFVRRAFGK